MPRDLPRDDAAHVAAFLALAAQLSEANVPLPPLPAPPTGQSPPDAWARWARAAAAAVYQAGTRIPDDVAAWIPLDGDEWATFWQSGRGERLTPDQVRAVVTYAPAHEAGKAAADLPLPADLVDTILAESDLDVLRGLADNADLTGDQIRRLADATGDYRVAESLATRDDTPLDVLDTILGRDPDDRHLPGFVATRLADTAHRNHAPVTAADVPATLPGRLVRLLLTAVDRTTATAAIAILADLQHPLTSEQTDVIVQHYGARAARLPGTHQHALDALLRTPPPNDDGDDGYWGWLTQPDLTAEDLWAVYQHTGVVHANLLRHEAATPDLASRMLASTAARPDWRWYDTNLHRLAESPITPIDDLTPLVTDTRFEPSVAAGILTNANASPAHLAAVATYAPLRLRLADHPRLPPPQRAHLMHRLWLTVENAPRSQRESRPDYLALRGLIAAASATGDSLTLDAAYAEPRRDWLRHLLTSVPGVLPLLARPDADPGQRAWVARTITTTRPADDLEQRERTALAVALADDPDPKIRAVIAECALLPVRDRQRLTHDPSRAVCAAAARGFTAALRG